MKPDANQAPLVAASEPTMRILMARSCPSLSGLSEIDYMVGCPVGSEDVSSICFRICGNSGGGKYNGDWVTIAQIERTLARVPNEQTFSAAALGSIYTGRSANSAGFLGAIVLAAGLIARAPDGRSYVRNAATAFWAAVQELIRSGVDLSPASMQPEDTHSSSGTPEPTGRKPKRAASKPASAAGNA